MLLHLLKRKGRLAGGTVIDIGESMLGRVLGCFVTAKTRSHVLPVGSITRGLVGTAWYRDVYHPVID